MKTLFKLLTLMLLVFVAHTLVLWSVGITRADPEKVAVDVMLVLGTEVEADGTPSVRLARRLNAALDAYEDFAPGQVVVSGGVGSSGYDEAVAMRDYLIAGGVSEKVIVVDSEGVDTKSSACNLADTVSRLPRLGGGETAVLIVSDYYHILRSRLAISQCGFGQIEDYAVIHYSPRDFYAIPREFVAFYYYLFAK